MLGPPRGVKVSLDGLQSLEEWTTNVIQIRKMSNRWGSCTAEGHILLNPDLIVAPLPCIEYVVAHELCHLREHNHGTDFYRLLTAMMPDWERRRERLNLCVAE